ncbi:hypothetical protein ACFRSX_37225 [Streptomyces goshikiensis]|uniref:hypothetical protein n=1 Tax=Streptomyces TaxID=1883 RepID=UPI000938C111|nr:MULTISPECIES: hypothetical protein [unclassified Streptomyces]OKI41747.1 hypothetical protein A6A28_24455 [Streptomyces sp. CB03578]PJN18284.1 hypothetical protein CG724_11590 [Streptomyces sp. CB02120-2]
MDIWVLTLTALCLGGIERFGQQGTQVAVIGFFAFSSGQGRIDYIGYLTASVTVGATHRPAMFTTGDRPSRTCTRR